MTDSPKIHVDDMHIRLNPAEIDSILGLRSTLNFFEHVEQNVASYIELGWQIKLVIPQLDITLDVDFRQSREIWMQNVTALAIKGIQTSLVVYTGAASNLLVLEVRGNNSEKTLILGRDWRAKCVIQIGGETEQHFFTWPGSLSRSNTKTLENVGIMIFGEGGKIFLPPSLVPGAEESIRWLTAPWQNPPGPPTPRLIEFLENHFPPAEENEKLEPDIPALEEILPQITSLDRLLQALFTPAANAINYYQLILEEARSAGIQDQRLILGLLWHAPLGSARHELNSLPWLQELMKEESPEEISGTSQIQNRLVDLINEFSKMMTDINKERKDTLKNSFKNLNPISATPLALGMGKDPLPPFPQNRDSEAGPDKNISAIPAMATKVEHPSWHLVHPAIFPQGEILVNRDKYEAMIYELGRLNALQKSTTQIIRESNGLKEKMESQRQEEINHLRQMALTKKFKKWW